MKLRLCVGVVLVLSLGLGAGALAAPPAADSLAHRQFGQWPLRTQLRVVSQRLEASRVPAAEQLVRQPGLARAVRSQLLFQLSKFYFFDIQPSLSLIHLLECRRLVQDDAPMRCEVEIELSYAYQWLRQPRPGQQHARTALGLAQQLGDARLQAKAYYMLAVCAQQLTDKPLALHYFLKSLQATRQRHQPQSLAVAQQGVAEAYLDLNQPRLARQWLDSTLASLRRSPTSAPSAQLYNTEFMHVSTTRLTAALLRREGHNARAITLLQTLLTGIRHANDRLLEVEVLGELVPALAAAGRYRAALVSQQRLTELQRVTYEENSRRRAQQLQTLYETQEKEQQLIRQRQRIVRLQARTQAREAQLYQRTLLFGALLAGAGLMLVLIVVRQRARHILATAAAALRMRTRIAADLHDEVGTLLTRVNLQAELLRQSQPEPAPALDRLLSNSRAAAGTMRDIVWSIDAESDTIGALLDRMRDHLDQTAAPAGLDTALTTHGLPDQEAVQPDIRQHLYLIFKEAVTNAVRHARGATHVHVDLRRHDGHLLLTVANDGQPAATATRSGMGLRNMQQRAAALRGQVEAGPDPTGGFRVSLRVPL